ncbi:DUF4252 domain-containing protein [Bergeyella sp. RCAD1439]|uniref:DUF4252 domain-containing protein n=1 Tax=Bergeyella anatis TaxID=3113737 RepID=UPI002E19399B|nr:DUF4252 domain-containing protein [Bergeyella sp. RCAD1439]
MRKIILWFMFWGGLGLIQAQNQSLSDFFEKHEGAEGVTSITIAKPMFGMLGKMDLGDTDFEAIKPVLNKIKGLRILVFQKPSDTLGLKDENKLQESKRLQTEVASLLENLNYDELMTVNRKEGKIRFLAGNVLDGVLDNLLLNIHSPQGSVFMLLEGKISMEDVNRLVNEEQGKNDQNKGRVPFSRMEERKVGAFKGVETSAGIRVRFKQGNAHRVVLKAGNPQWLENVSTQVENGVLRIRFQAVPGVRSVVGSLDVEVEAPDLESVELSSGAKFWADGPLSAERFRVAVSSAAQFDAALSVKRTVEVDASSGAVVKGRITAEQLRIHSRSASQITLEGQVDRADFQVSSASSVEALSLLAREAEARVSSVGKLKTYVTEKLWAEVSSNGAVYYGGKPRTVETKREMNQNGILRPL